MTISVSTICFVDVAKAVNFRLDSFLNFSKQINTACSFLRLVQRVSIS